ncbi:MAG: divergent polysaccharide deacetylase family protein [Deltaproteobacteria bacterium]|nr:divergent polysaccharide deacetylase family protein [Deltaproteobacteria bacterium]
MADRKKIKNNPRQRPWLTASLLGLLLIITLAAAFYFIFLRAGYTTGPVRPVYQYNQPHASTRLIIPVSQKRPFIAKIAIVIDDIGNQKKLAEEIMALDLNLSFSILPYRPFSKILARKAVSLGRDVLLHLPMEPQDHKWNPGKGALLLSMSRADILTTLTGDLAQVPMAAGVNNHMGSAFTENRAAMGTVLTDLRQHKGLFWLDSMTTPRSVGFAMAREMGLVSARRDIFLDNIQKSTAIIKQLDKLVNLARRQGHAIGIAHPHPETLKALKRYQYTLRQKVQLVGIKTIMLM